MNRVARFRFKTDMAVQQYTASGHDLVYGPELSRLFPHYLMTLHSIIRASEPLLQAAVVESARRFGEGDESCRGLADYLAGHVLEEAHHAEWLLEDIASLGFAREDVLRRRPLRDVASLVGSQYYWIHHYHPGLFLGYMVIFEGYPTTMEQIAHFKQATGLPDTAFRTMRLHTELDVQHSADIFRFLESCALPDAIFDELAEAAIHTCSTMSRIFREMAKEAGVGA